MAHFAEINENSIVTRVLVTDSNDPNGDEGYQWLVDNFGGTWVKTSYNTYGGVHSKNGTPLRKNYAGPGMTYDPIRDAFIPQKPFGSWTLNEDSCLWEAPIPKPDESNGEIWKWDEESLSWKNLTI